MSRPSGRSVALASMWGLAVFAVDQASKVWAARALAGGRDIPVIGQWMSLRLHYNPGAAFSFATGATWVFTVIAALVVLGLPWAFRSAPSRLWAVGLGCVWGGAAGNLADRLVRAPGFGRGHVVDFIRYGDWFIGNIADIALVLGVAGLVLLSFSGSGDVRQAHPGDDGVGEVGGGAGESDGGAEQSGDGVGEAGDSTGMTGGGTGEGGRAPGGAGPMAQAASPAGREPSRSENSAPRDPEAVRGQGDA